MRATFLLLTLFLVQVFASDPETDEAIEPDTQENIIEFTCSVLTPELAQSKFSVSNDTVDFRLYYVDVVCNEYEYEFERDGKSLIVRRVTVEPNACDEESEQLYAFEGKMINVPEGKFLFELESAYGSSKNSLFREVIIVK